MSVPILLRLNVHVCSACGAGFATEQHATRHVGGQRCRGARVDKVRCGAIQLTDDTPGNFVCPSRGATINSHGPNAISAGGNVTIHNLHITGIV